ncbi:hypothetical protein QE374_000162 [Microbacterium sp. SORGH_AS428]|uniref:methyltransferase n=1 Tax=Microbacterium sp. SORGH_AS_0428 TaxID=3041788 RepID=UPI002862E595|nr:methyltransferase [Microbacterium sp. SORGH_AS_0428]MDR6198253.1 hypothetical protein [Microbacterium sp. SORGH_AS_0428]
MSTTEALWVAYGNAGVVGSIRKDAGGYVVTMSGADAHLGSYPSMEIAKGALRAHLKPGSARPEFRQH